MLITIIFSIGFFIVFELLKEFGFFQYIYEIFYTHPKFDKYIRIFGDLIVGVSISIVGAAVYQYFINSVIMYYALTFGIIWILIGSIMKEYKS